MSYGPGYCEHRVHVDGPHSRPCNRKFKVKEADGTKVCTQHSTAAYKARRAKVSAKVDQLMINMQRMGKLQIARDAVVTAAKAWAKAHVWEVSEFEGNLVEAVKKLNELEGKP